MDKIVLCLLCAMLFCIPWEEIAVLPYIDTIVFLLGCLALPAAGLGVALRLRVKRPSLAFAFLTLCVAWNVLSITWALNQTAAVHRSITYASLLAFSWMICEFADTEERVLWLFRAYVFGCCVSLGTLFAAYVSGLNIYSSYVTRFTGGGLNENDLATVLNIAILLAVYLATRPAAKSTVLRKVFWTFIPAAGIGVVLTGSRTGVLVLGVGLVFSAFTLRLRGWKALVFLILLVAGTAYFARGVVSEQLATHLTEGTESRTWKMRTEYWRAGLTDWLEHPLTGCGTGCCRAAITAKLSSSEGNVAHNVFISVLVEGGLVGFGIMLAFWLLLLRMILAMPRTERLLWLSVFAIWGISSMALSMEYYKTTWFIYAATMAHSAALRQQLRMRQNGEKYSNQHLLRRS